MGSSEHMDWVFRARDYELETKRLRTQCVSTLEHPLRGTVVTSVVGSNVRSTKPSTQTTTSQKSTAPSDPLNIISASENSFEDPLSMMARAESAMSSSNSTRKKNDSSQKFGDAEGYIDETFEPWSEKRADVLLKFTTSEKLTISTSFLSDNDKERIQVKQQASTTADTVKTRLEQLDDFEDGSVKEMLNLSQTDYVNRIEQLNSTLASAWSSEQRVKSLKIAIQCAKLISDVSVLQFYPSQFVLITDILDNFGNLVYERIRGKSTTLVAGSNTPKPLRKDFTPEEVPETAKETCRNWFYKVSSIRELIPRLYVEMAILKCYCFLTTTEYSQALLRLTHQIRGIADPLVAIYARCYLCRVGINVAPQLRDHLDPCWSDYLNTYSQLKHTTLKEKLSKQNLDMPGYAKLFRPALEWLLQCIAFKASVSALTNILEKCRSCNSALILNSIMSAFDPKYIASRATDFITLIKESEDSGLPKHLLYRSLGVTITLEDPNEESRLTILNDVWKAVMKMKDASDYMSCAEVWIEYPVKFFSLNEVNTMMGNIIKHMSVDRAFENNYPQLLSVVSKVLGCVPTHGFTAVLMMDNFLPFLDMFQKEAMKVEACKSIMTAYKRTTTATAVDADPVELSDTVIINALMAICKTMHDSISAISLQDERRVIANLISTFISSVSFGRDFEHLLNFYVDARANFSNIDAVLVTLVQNVNTIAANTRVLVKGNHSKKTAAFVRACMAYSFITIPSMSDIFIRMKLYLLCGQTALANHAVGQSDAFFKAAISLLAEVPKQVEIEGKMRSSGQFFIEYINSLFSTLLVVPDHPEQGVIYLLYGVLNVLQNYEWGEDNLDTKTKIFLSALCLLSASCQETYAYRVHGVDSNDKLYGAGSKFIAELKKVLSQLVEQVLEQLKEIGEKSAKKQSSLALSFVNCIMAHGNLSAPPMLLLAQNLWRLATQYEQHDAHLVKRLKGGVEQRANTDSGFSEFLRIINNIPSASS